MKCVGSLITGSSGVVVRCLQYLRPVPARGAPAVVIQRKKTACRKANLSVRSVEGRCSQAARRSRNPPGRVRLRSERCRNPPSFRAGRLSILFEIQNSTICQTGFQRFCRDTVKCTFAKVCSEHRAITECRLLHPASPIQPAKPRQGFIPQCLM
jgi:hypothetical protein